MSSRDEDKRAALERLYRRQSRGVLAFFTARVGAQQAIDLMGETFATALERSDQLRGTSDDQVSGWVWAIARSVLRDYEQRAAAERRNRPRLLNERRELTDHELERIDQLGADAPLRRAVVDRLAQLPVGWQEAVRLRFVEELSYQEIAERLSITASTARSFVSRALERLAHELEFEREQEQQ